MEIFLLQLLIKLDEIKMIKNNINMKNKRGQITIYIIIGILIVAMFFLWSFMQERKVEQNIESFDNVEMYVQECLEQTSKEQLYQLGYIGGMLESDDYIISDIGDVPVYVLGDKLNKSIFIKNLEKMVKINIDFCFDDFNALKNQGYSFEFFEKEIEIFGNSKITFNLDYPMKVTKAGTTKAYSDFTYSIDVDIDSLVNVTNKLLDVVLEKPDEVPLMLMLSLKENNGYDINAYNALGYTIYVIEISEQDFIFMFAVKGGENEAA